MASTFSQFDSWHRGLQSKPVCVIPGRLHTHNGIIPSYSCHATGKNMTPEQKEMGAFFSKNGKETAVGEPSGSSKGYRDQIN